VAGVLPKPSDFLTAEQIHGRRARFDVVWVLLMLHAVMRI
jgi:hypothetical protein